MSSPGNIHGEARAMEARRCNCLCLIDLALEFFAGRLFETFFFPEGSNVVAIRKVNFEKDHHNYAAKKQTRQMFFVQI